MRCVTRLVELDRARDLRPAAAGSPPPTGGRTRAARGTAPACGGSRCSSAEEVEHDRGRRRRSPCRGRPSSPAWRSRARRRTRASSRFSSSASANCAELLAHVVELVLLLGDLEQRARVDLGDLLHGAQLRRSLRAPRSRARSSASSTSRFWSSSSSVLRVTFSVARTVRSATSPRISWIARRVSASMSRRVCSSAPRAGPWPARAPRARGPRPPCARGRRSRRPGGAPRAGARGTRRAAPAASACASSRPSRSSPRSRCWRLSSASVIAGQAYLRRMSSAIRKASSVQIISPMSGLTRKLRALLLGRLAVRPGRG